MENIEIEKEILAEKKSISHLRTFLLIFLLGVVSAFAIFYYITQQHAGRQMADTSVLDVRLENIADSVPLHEKRIAKLEEDIQKLEKTQSTAVAPVPNTELTDRIATLEAEIKSLKSSGPSHKASASDSQQTARAISLLSVFYHLSSNITSGKPFIAELSSFQEKFGTEDKSLNDLVAAIMPYAENGIPTTNKLISAFDDSIDAMKRNDNSLPENAGFWEKLVFNISHMVTIRKVDKTQTGNSTNAILGRAEDHLDHEEVEAAITEVKSLPENVRNNFSLWLEDAQMASAAPSIVEQIEEKVMKKAFSVPQDN